MIDDMQELYSHASEAYRAGKREGRYDYYRALQERLAAISIKYEQGPVDGPQEPLATRGFHVAQECAKASRELLDQFNQVKLVL